MRAAAAALLCLWAPVASAGWCTYPSVCTPPAAAYSSVAPLQPRKQWGSSGGFCGANSIQMIAMTYGNYYSQAEVRKGATHGEGHGNPTDGFEILPTNIEDALDSLALTYESFDHVNTPKPQWPAYSAWMKAKLVKQQGVVAFVMTRGDGDEIPYPGSNPDGGRFSHIEPVWGVFSNRSLDDPTVYPEDVIVHGSDWDTNGHYRTFASLPDNYTMNGNCKRAIPIPSLNEAFPCWFPEVSYGSAITGNVDPKNAALRASLAVDTVDEPNVTTGSAPNKVHGTLTIYNTTPGAAYTVYRYEDRTKVPRNSDFAEGYAVKYTVTADAATATFADPKAFLSDQSVFYRVVAA